MTIILGIAGAIFTIVVVRYAINQFANFMGENRKNIGKTHRVKE